MLIATIAAHDVTAPAAISYRQLGDPSVIPDKIYRELWEQARGTGADAVIHARYGKSHITALSWGSTSATGDAIRFTR